MEPLASQVADELSENAEQTRSAIEKFFDHFSLPKLVSAAILLVICIICIKIILRATEKMLKSSKLDKSCHAFIRSSIKIVLVFLAIMLLAGTLGVDTSSLLAILSVAGLAVSLSIQDSLSNLASAVVLLTTHPFKVGDFIEVGGKSGTVRQIGVFHTQIATPDNQLVYLPNSQITSAQITNVTGSELRRIELTVQASYDAPPETVNPTTGRRFFSAYSNSAVMRSPTTVPIEPSMNSGFITKIAVFCPSILVTPQRTPSFSRLFAFADVYFSR